MFLGIDSFSNILQKLEQTLEKKPETEAGPTKSDAPVTPVAPSASVAAPAASAAPQAAKSATKPVTVKKVVKKSK